MKKLFNPKAQNDRHFPNFFFFFFVIRFLCKKETQILRNANDEDKGKILKGYCL